MSLLAVGRAWEEALAREWLAVDGLGGYASGTILGPHTRRYHGLLVAPLAPPLGRHVLVSKLEETLEIGGVRYDLSSNQFQDGTIAPRGFDNLEAFALDEGVPTWSYRAGNARLTKRVWMERGRTTTYVSYALDVSPESAPAQLHLTPLCAFRDFHRETVGSEDWRLRTAPIQGGIEVRAYGGATPYFLQFVAPRGQQPVLQGRGGWWWHFLHREERARGLGDGEDLFAVGTVSFELYQGEMVLVGASLEPSPPGPLSLAKGEGEAGGNGFEGQLRRAAEQFLVARAVPGQAVDLEPNGAPVAGTVLAGYHWFGDWGRDTMIALPGLALATGRFEEARAILRAFSRYVDRGMLPNRFPDSGAPLGDGDYNTVDATLWYFHAIHALEEMDPDGAGTLVEDLYAVLVDIVEWHVRGTRFGIHMDPVDGLIRVADPQLTWMDAKVGDWVCTPRAGKPVEIAALWIHALALLGSWAERLDRPAEVARFGELRRQAAAGFRERFWNDGGGFLYDVVDTPAGDGKVGDDASLRPNQAIAAALADCPLTPEQRRSIVDVIAHQLWTPRGLRTLSPADARYRGRYGGDSWQRDGAYHQGTVWPWLLGPFVDAHLLVYQDPTTARRFLEPLRDHLFDEACAGSISEVFDGDPPHAPGGCITQAWSVAEVYRSWMATTGR